MSETEGRIPGVSLPHALLGLLAVEPRSGYELTKAFEADLGRYAWQAGHTSIYPELNRLAGEGLLEVTHEGARGSRTHAGTARGRGGGGSEGGPPEGPPRQPHLRGHRRRARGAALVADGPAAVGEGPQRAGA